MLTEAKLSALDAAAKVLAASAESLKTKQMAAKGLWTSPGGKTPHATLNAPRSHVWRFVVGGWHLVLTALGTLALAHVGLLMRPTRQTLAT